MLSYQNTRTYTQSGAENSLFQVCLTITKPYSPFYLEEMKTYLSLSVSRAVSCCLYIRVLALNEK